MTEQQERSQIRSRLRSAGIRHTLQELFDDPRLEPQCTAELLELLKSPYSLSTRVHIAEALFDRKPKRAQKREAIDIVLKLYPEHRGESADEDSDAPHLLSFLAVNGLASCIEARDADAIIQMTLDPRYGLLRTSFTYVLYRIGTPAAIACLRQMTKDPLVASSALYKLALMNEPGIAELCDKALKIPGVQYTDMIKKLRAKLKRQPAKKPAAPAGPSHATKKPIPKGLAEWSTNLDAADLPRTLRRIAKCISSGFAKAEVSEVQSAAERLALDQHIRFKFSVKVNRAQTTLWLELFCDDEEEYDLAVFGDAKLIARLDGKARRPG